MDKAVAPVRQRPEEILAQTLNAPAHHETVDGWSSRGRRIFLLCMAVAGVVLVAAGLLVTKELAPGPGNPAPLQTGPGNGLAGQLLQSNADEPPPTPSASVPIALPLPTAPATHSTQVPDAPAPTTAGTVAPTPPTATQSDHTKPTIVPPPSPTTTVPCSGLLGQTLQQSQLLPCNSPAGLPIGTKSH